MRKSLWLALTLSVLLATQVTSTYACYKAVYPVSDGDGDGILETDEKIVMIMAIILYNENSSVMTNIVITDNLNAELDIDLAYGFRKTQGTVSYSLSGKTDKWSIVWNIGTLMPGERAVLWFQVFTDINPGGNQEYTTPGTYELNSGPTLKYKLSGVKYSEVFPPITIDVLLQNG